MVDLAQFGLEKSINLHIIPSIFLWWLAVIIATQAFRYRRLWDVGDPPWNFLFLTFITFGIRELGHFGTSPYISSLRSLFGVWSAIFMASAFIYLWVRICRRKKDFRIINYAPFAFAIIPAVAAVYLYRSGTDIYSLKNMLQIIESLVWLLAGSVIIYTAYTLGTQVTGRFTSVFMFFQFSGYSAFTWKLLGLLESMGSSMPYSVREIIETMFGLFALISMYVLLRMLRKLSRHIYGK